MTRRIASIPIAVSLLLMLAAPAAAQSAAIANKTAIYTIEGVPGASYVYVAPSGNVYSNLAVTDKGTGHEYRLGRTIVHSYNSGGAACRASNHASASGSALSLTSTTTCGSADVAPMTASGTVRIQFNGDTCSVTWTPRSGAARISSCRVVAGNQMPR